MDMDLMRVLRKRFSLSDEKQTQDDIENALKQANINYKREFYLTKEDKIDFFVNDNIGLEVKLAGSKKNIYRQCERYCLSDKIKEIILITKVSMGLPKEINGKKTYIIDLGRAWL